MNDNQTTLKITKGARGGRGWVKLTRISNTTTVNARGRGRGRGRGNIHLNDNYRSNVRRYTPKSIHNNNDNQSTDKSVANNTIMNNNNKNIPSKNTKQSIKSVNKNNINNNESMHKPTINSNKTTIHKKTVDSQNTKQNKSNKISKAKINKTNKANKPKNTKKSHKKRPKPSSQVNLCDFINISKNKKRKFKKKLTLHQKVLKLEKAFKIKEELQNHPYIIKQQKLKQQRIEYRKKHPKKAATQNNDNNNIKTIEKKPYKPKDKSEKTKTKKPSSQKKHIKKGRIDKDVVNVVEFLVNTVCNPHAETAYLNHIHNKKLKNRKTRQRKKEMDKLKKIQPDLLQNRNKFKDSHCGVHGVIMKYPEIRSYSNHLTSNELHDRVGFLLNKLSILQCAEREKMRENEKNKHNNINASENVNVNSKIREHKFFLCGMKECLKTLRRGDGSVIGVIMSSQMEPLPERSGLDKMIEEIKYLCQQQHGHGERCIEIIYALNRKQLNYILKLKPWQGNVSCVTLLDVNIYSDTWNRIVQMKYALHEQYLMLQYDFIPVFRAVSVKKRFVPEYERKRKVNVENEVKHDEKDKGNNYKRDGKVKLVKKIKKVNHGIYRQDNSKEKKTVSKLSASASPFQPIPVQMQAMQSNFQWQRNPNMNSFANVNQFQMNNIQFANMPFANVGFGGNPYMNNMNNRNNHNNGSTTQDWK